jgi:hypothetical protein
VVTVLGDRIDLRGDIVGGSTFGALTSVDQVMNLFAAMGTSIWYMWVVSGGLVAVAWVAGAVELWRPSRDVAFRSTIGVALASTIAVAFAAALILAGLPQNNSDAMYTRYVQMFVPFWLLAGLAALLTTKPRTALRLGAVAALALAGSGAFVVYRLWYVRHQGHHLSYGVFGGPDLMAVTGGWTRFRPLAGTMIGLIACAVLVAGTRWRRLGVPLMVALLLADVATMGVLRRHIVTPLGARATPSPHLPAFGVGPVDRVAMSWGLPGGLYFGLQHEVTWMNVTYTNDPPANVDVVVARWRNPEAKDDWDGAAHGFRLVGTSGQHWAVWRRP